MESLLVAAIIIGVINLYRYWKQNQDTEDVVEVQEVTPSADEGTPSATRDLVLSTLDKMRIEYSEEDELRIRLTFQGETFMIDAHNDCLFINVYDPWWFDLPMHGDIEDFARMQKAVNLANCTGTCTVLYTYNEEEGLAELLKENPNFKLFNDDFKRHLSQDSNSNNTRNYNSVNSQFGNFRNPNAMRRNVDPQCCCIIL